MFGGTRRNVVANFAGSGWTALVSLAFVPVYIRFLGVEAYGLVGLFVTVQAVFALVEMGLSGTLTRELASRSERAGSGPDERRALVRTLEAILWPLSLLCGVLLILAAPWVAGSWLQTSALPPETTRRALELMGVALAFHLPFGFYAGGLQGLQRQVLLNSVIAVTVSIRAVGAVLLLWLVEPTIVVFFGWQIAASLFQTGATAAAMRRCLPGGSGGTGFRLDLLRDVGGFAAGMTAITVLSIILAQLDKILLSRMLSLEMFGYYTLAGVVATSLYRLISPFFAALYPRFSQLVASGDRVRLVSVYHAGAQALTVALSPVAVVIALFPGEILLLWTSDPEIARNSALLVALLSTGTVVNGLVSIPYALQLAHGWTRLSLYSNAVAIVVLTPLLVVATRAYGAPGAASIWLLLNVGYLVVNTHLIHRRLLPTERWRWLVEDVGMPLLAAVAVGAVARVLLPTSGSAVLTFLGLAATAFAALVAAVLSASTVRRWAMETLSPQRLVHER
jgi:O-antigen/teichoic acid export membrane protein